MRKLPRSLKHRDNQFATVVEDNVARRSEKVIDCKLRIFYHHFRNGTLSPLGISSIEVGSKGLSSKPAVDSHQNFHRLKLENIFFKFKLISYNKCNKNLVVTEH